MNGVSKSVENLIYRTYEKKLLKKIKCDRVPHHMAIIMDGNRRFAQQFGFTHVEGHAKGRDKLEEVLDWCLEIGIKILTVYAFSTENLKREKEEIDELMALFIKGFRDAAQDERVHKHKIKISTIGQVDILPKNVRDAIDYAKERTKDYNDFFYNIAIAYGSREEIIQAIRKIAQDAKDEKIKIEKINEELFSSYLYTSDFPDPDLIIRTSGEERISNFLLWQIAYSELYFTDVYWPGFRKIDFLRAIRSYQERKRRYGK